MIRLPRAPADLGLVLLVLAMLPAIACAQGASQAEVRRADMQADPAREAVTKPKAARASEVHRKSVARPASPAPTGTSPGSTSSPGPTQSSSTVGLSWGAVSGTTYYGLAVRDMTTNALVVDTTTTGTSYTASLTAGGQYRWNVAACNATGCWSYTIPLYFQTPTPTVATPATPTAAPLLAGDLAKCTAAELDALIAEQRKVIKTAPRDETARRNLGLISVEAANRILQAQSMGRAQEVSAYTALVRTSLADTLWRVTQFSREDRVRAQAALGLYHADGILVPMDPVRGCDYFAKAAAAGQLAAAYRASQCLSKLEPERAQRWLEQSAVGGNPAAQETMGRACIEGASIDAACAKKWLQPAAAQGRVSAMSVLAWLYARDGTTESLSKASNLYRTAAEAGDFAAQNNLGELFETGRGVSREPASALGWYRKSAESGFAPAQFNLARLLAFGIGTERDTAAAREWATRAQGQGIAQAAELLKLISDAEKPR